MVDLRGRPGGQRAQLYLTAINESDCGLRITSVHLIGDDCLADFHQCFGHYCLYRCRARHELGQDFDCDFAAITGFHIE